MRSLLRFLVMLPFVLVYLSLAAVGAIFHGISVGIRWCADTVAGAGDRVSRAIFDRGGMP